MFTEEQAEVEETQEEPEEEPETEETVETPAPEAKAPEDPPKAKALSNELKVIIIMKADRIMLGVQSPGCDPVYKMMTGTLDEALAQVSAFVTEAKQKWATAPLYPKANLPEPPPAPTPARTPARTPATTKPAAPKAQPSLF